MQRVHPADLLTYCYDHKVAHLLWIFIEVFLGRERLGCRKNVCYHCYLSGAFGEVAGNLVQYHFVAVCARVCVCVLRMFSHSYQCVLGCASAPAFYQCNPLSFKDLVKKMPRVWEIKSAEKSKSVGGQWKITLKTNTMVNRQGCGQKAGGLCCLKVDFEWGIGTRYMNRDNIWSITQKESGKKWERDSSSSRTWERLTLKHPSAGQTGSVCNSLSTKTHSVYLGQQEKGPGEEKSKSQHRPSRAPQFCTQLSTVLFLQHFQLSFCKAALNWSLRCPTSRSLQVPPSFYSSHVVLC